MRIAHLLITYTNAFQTERLIRKLQHEQFDFYIHLDTKVSMETHENLKKIPNVYFVRKRVNVRWAGYSTVEAIFNSIEEIVKSGRKYDYINLMSGQDYPIKSTAYIYDFFCKNAGKEFMMYDHFDMWPEESYPRIRKYNMTNYDFRGKYVIEKFLNFLFPSRKSPPGLKFYGKSMFWALSPECARYVVDYVRKNSSFKRFLHFSWGSDEFVFQTVLLNSMYKDKIVNLNLIYFERPFKAPHPNILCEKDFEKLMQSDKLFARKFDINTDIRILDMIDKATAPLNGSDYKKEPVTNSQNKIVSR